MLPLDSGPKLAVGQGNFVCCLIIVVIFLGLGRTYRLGGDFKVVIRVISHKGMGPFLWGEFDPLRHNVKILIWQLEEG